MENQFERTELLIGKEAVKKLNNSKVCIFGLGGVGSFVCEALVRAGVENFILIDNDTVDITNLNRQIIATRKTINKYKVDVMEERMKEINPEINIIKIKEFISKDSKLEFIDNSIDYIIDAIDTVSAKIELVMKANELNIQIISAMGTGNKLNPTELEVTDISKTEMCPLAKVMRKELRNRNIKHLKVVYSKEKPKLENNIKKDVPGSISFVPSVAGLIIASEVVKDIIDKH